MAVNGKKKKKKIVLVVVISIILLLITCWMALCIKLYDDNINISADSYEPLMLRVSDFEGLECKEYSFTSDKGQNLAGYLYSKCREVHGIVIIAHGFGAGHNSYMDVADYFAGNGYLVFAYDATAMDKSEGESLGGVPQGVIDLDHAISFVENCHEIPDLPIVLFGHSWGGYSVSSVLTYHPEVSAVIECSGFNSSPDMFESGGKDVAGNVIYAMRPCISIYEHIKYGKYAENTAMDGFDSTDAPVMIVHSADDGVIGIEYGLDKYYKKYAEDPRFTFIRFEDRGHNDIFNDPDNTYKDEFNADFDKWLETLDYDYLAKENMERFKADKAAYITENLDHARWSHRLDEDLFSGFLDFYDRSIEKTGEAQGTSSKPATPEGASERAPAKLAVPGTVVEGVILPEYYEFEYPDDFRTFMDSVIECSKNDDIMDSVVGFLRNMIRFI